MPKIAERQTGSFLGRDGRKRTFGDVRKRVGQRMKSGRFPGLPGRTDPPVVLEGLRLVVAFASDEGVHLSDGVLEGVDAVVVVRGEGHWEAEVERWRGMFVIPCDEFERVQRFIIKVPSARRSTGGLMKANTSARASVAVRRSSGSRAQVRRPMPDPAPLGPFGDRELLDLYLVRVRQRVRTFAHYDWARFSWRCSDSSGARRWQLCVPHKHGGPSMLFKPMPRQLRGPLHKATEVIAKRIAERVGHVKQGGLERAEWCFDRGAEHPLARAATSA